MDLRLNGAGALSKTLGAGGNELGIAAGGVGTSHLSASGSSSGQTLVSSGAAVSWGTPSVPARRFYLTLNTVNGSQAPSSCAAGYHMASIWEVLNVSVLVYETTLATVGDQGSGPPSNGAGWMRTGFGSGFTTNSVGAANCNLWGSALNTDYGTVGFLNYQAWNAPWAGLTFTCNTLRSVWCVQN